MAATAEDRPCWRMHVLGYVLGLTFAGAGVWRIGEHLAHPPRPGTWGWFVAWDMVAWWLVLALLPLFGYTREYGRLRWLVSDVPLRERLLVTAAYSVVCALAGVTATVIVHLAAR